MSPHGEQVIKAVMKEGVIGAFIKDWRRNFKEKMDCKFLPEGWNVDH